MEASFEELYREAAPQGQEGAPAEEPVQEEPAGSEQQPEDEREAPVSRKDLEKLHRDLNKGLQKAFREYAELKRELQEARATLSDAERAGDGVVFEDPLEAIRQEIAELKAHLRGAAELTAQQQAEARAMQICESVAARVGKAYSVGIEPAELLEATKEREFPPPETFEQLETYFDLVAKDLAVQKKTGKPRPKPAPTVQKSSSAAAQTVKATLPSLDDMSFEDIYRHYKQND